ncbi:hypothetical protein GCM10020219_052530 [Nonomuraea dietziae]
MSWEELQEWRAELMAAFERALPHSVLPVAPDRGAVEEFLIDVRRANL